MKFEELLRIVRDKPVFSTGILLAGDTTPERVRVQLSRWVREGKVIRLRRGLVRQGYDITVKNRKVSAADWPAIRRDIAPFLENPSEAEYMNGSDMVQALSDSGVF